MEKPSTSTFARLSAPMKAMALPAIPSIEVGTCPELLEMPALLNRMTSRSLAKPSVTAGSQWSIVTVKCWLKTSGTAAARAGGCEPAARALSLSGYRIRQERQGCSRAIDVVLHHGRSAHPDRPDNLAVHLDGKPATPRRYTRKRGDAGQKRRVALDKVEKVLSGDAE